MNTEYLIRLALILGQHRKLKLTTVSTYACRDGKVLGQLQAGAGITVRRYGDILRWFSDHWPDNLAWPPDIPRPRRTPPPGSDTQLPNARNGSRDGTAKPPANATACRVLAAVRAALERRDEAALSDDWRGVDEAKEAALNVACTLGPDGTLASPDAFCRALKVSRATYDKTVERFSDGTPGESAKPRQFRGRPSAPRKYWTRLRPAATGASRANGPGLRKKRKEPQASGGSGPET